MASLSLQNNLIRQYIIINASIAHNKLEGKWLTKKELINNYSKFESWSKHIINYLVDNKIPGSEYEDKLYLRLEVKKKKKDSKISLVCF